MVIDEKGEQLGVLETSQALTMAQERGFDLVEVSPVAKPPVCRIMDYGKFQYKQNRTQQKAKKVETKGVRLSFKIGEHDLLVKKKQVTKFLDQGHNVKVELRLKGRERAFKPKAREKIKQFLESLGIEYKMDKDIQAQGPTLSVTISKNN
ncbi:translation initiation factor IF-3 [Candidatus Parcubacteria bacterium]|jgi:translation initiation factor IF-3|nr:translation initiation factor IF-3 [Candidatus Parcubacteria bacterium]